MSQPSKKPLKKQVIYIDGKDKTDEIESYSFVGNKCIVVYKNNNKSYSYGQGKVQIVKSAVQSKKSETIFFI